MEEVNKHKPENIGDSKYNRQAAVWLGVVAVLALRPFCHADDLWAEAWG